MELAGPTELKAIDSCQFAFTLKRDDVCINPYHYVRIEIPGEHVCVCVYMYVCMCACVCACVVCLHMCGVCVCMCVFACVVCLHVCGVCVHVCVCMYAWTEILVVKTHAHTRTHTHTYPLNPYAHGSSVKEEREVCV